MTRLLTVASLKTVFHTETGEVAAVDDVSFALDAGEVLGIVGESGSGKSVTAFSLLGLVAFPGEVARGTAMIADVDLLAADRRTMRRMRGRTISMIFQEPLSSLNPIQTVGTQVAEPLILHFGLGKRQARAKALAMLQRVGIPDAERRFSAYPHELSGGLRQRVMIAMALVCEPKLLIADEPTTALDVTVQAQILALLKELQEEMGMAIMMITHDLGVIAEMADRVAVMYAGRIVEVASVAALFAAPRHPYTAALVKGIPDLAVHRRRLPTIEGSVPAPDRMPAGCRFAPRCAHAQPRCTEIDPPLVPFAGAEVACIRAEELAAAGALLPDDVDA